MSQVAQEMFSWRGWEGGIRNYFLKWANTYLKIIAFPIWIFYNDNIYVIDIIF